MSSRVIRKNRRRCDREHDEHSNFPRQHIKIWTYYSERSDGEKAKSSQCTSPTYIDGACRNDSGTRRPPPSLSAPSQQKITVDCTDQRPNNLRKACAWSAAGCAMSGYKRAEQGHIVGVLLPMDERRIRRLLRAQQRVWLSSDTVMVVFNLKGNCGISKLSNRWPFSDGWSPTMRMPVERRAS